MAYVQIYLGRKYVLILFKKKIWLPEFQVYMEKSFMVIFQNFIYLSLFNSLTTFSISGINQSAHSVHSPMLNYFLFISHSLIKLEFSPTVKKMTWQGVEPESVDW